MQAIFGLNSQYTITLDGKEYRARVIDEDFQDEWAKAYYAQACAAAREQKDCMERDEYLAYLRSMNDARLAGEYNFMSPQSRKFMKTENGVVLLFSIMFGLAKGDTVRLLSAHCDEMLNLFDLNAKESFRDNPAALEAYAKKAAEGKEAPSRPPGS